MISTPLIPILVGRFGWLAATATGSVVALLGAVLWFWIWSDHPLGTERFEAGTMGLMCGIKSEDGR